MKKILTGSLLCALLLSSSEAFDEQKEGFLVGFGVGVSSINTEADFNYISVEERNTGLATSFKLGYGFSNQFLLYYSNDVTWYGYDNDPNDDTYISGMSGIGISYFLNENDPYYLMGAIGIGSFSNFSEGKGDTGSAFSLGVGYEIAYHTQIEATYLATNIKENGIDFNNNAFRITLNYLWY